MVLFCWLAVCGSAAADEITDLLTGKVSESQPPIDRVISTGASAQQDRKIRQRLGEIFAELDTLKDVGIKVNGGVVTLTGEIGSAAVEERAIAFARQVEGVVEVKNQLTVSRDLATRLRNTWQKIVAFGESIAVSAPLLLFAIFIVVLFSWAGGWLSRRQSLYRRISPNLFIAHLLGQFTQMLFFLLGLVVALVLLDATALIGTILGAAGIIGLAVGFAVRDTVENYIASILLSLRNPFEVNDFVNIDGHEGNVVRLTSRATILLSPDGNHIRIPNAAVFKAVITNFTRHPERRFSFDVGVDTDQDLLVAQALALKTLSTITGVEADPKPMAIVEALGDSNVLLRIFAWVDQRKFSFAKVRSEAIRAVKTAFDDAGIVMPEPIYKLRFTDGLPTAAGSSANATLSETTHQAPEPVAPDRQNVAEVQDVSADRTIEEKVEEEEAMRGEENLLDASNPKEM
ncbi:mechanosensitive ion channel domain-containing protein [Thiosocius teredinicola]|uniref:mechanosensitive ion channel domain-containing protein n=1 Tax=Thiosocius teredinicola TaxID=1973002 RepID=UPI0009909FF5